MRANIISFTACIVNSQRSHWTQWSKAIWYPFPYIWLLTSKLTLVFDLKFCMFCFVLFFCLPVRLFLCFFVCLFACLFVCFILFSLFVYLVYLLVIYWIIFTSSCSGSPYKGLSMSKSSSSSSVFSSAWGSNATLYHRPLALVIEDIKSLPPPLLNG